MGEEKSCGYELVDDQTIQVLVCLPVKSLLRFKAVCKSWCALIQTSFFINLHISSSSSSSNKFGSFILHVEVDKSEVGLKENALLMLSESSEFRSSESSEFRSSESSESISESESESESVVCWWSTDPDVRRGGPYGSNWRKKSDGEEDNDQDNKSNDQVFEVDNTNYNFFRLDCLGFPSCYKSSATPRVIGSCNGVICLHGHTFDRKTREFSLWNPATRQFRILPKSIIIHEEDGGGGIGVGDDGNNNRSRLCSYLIAFGFDVKTKDYKVVFVTGFKPKRWFAAAPLECPCRIQVYSLSTDSWRILEGITSLPGYPFIGTLDGQYLNGSCFFMAKFFPSEQQQQMWSLKNDRFIISLDLTKEIITTIQIPDHDTYQKLYLSYLGDKMALFTISNPNLTFDGVRYNQSEKYDHEDYDIWVLNNEHGGGSSSSVNKESWKNLYSFQIKCRLPGQLNVWNIPKGISNDGVFALIETKSITGLGKKMKLYNLVTKEVKKNFLVCHGVMSRAAEVYRPSLVSIIGGNGRNSSSSSSR